MSEEKVILLLSKIGMLAKIGKRSCLSSDEHIAVSSMISDLVNEAWCEVGNK